MYQFIVATRSNGTCVGTGNSSWSGARATVGDISTMALAGNGTNKWASRAVVALQLAAWSAVGIVLLEKGISSLQKSPHTPPLNVSQEMTTPTSSSNSPQIQIPSDSERAESLSEPELDPDPLSVIPLADDDETPTRKSLPKNPSNPKSSDQSLNPRQHLDQTDEKLSNPSTPKIEQVNRSKDTNEKKDIYLDKLIPRFFHNVEQDPREDQEDPREDEEDPREDQEDPREDQEDPREDQEDPREDEEEPREQARDNPNAEINRQDKSWTNPVTIKVIMEDFEEHRWENRKRLRVSRVNAGGGAAAAMAMVAVGAIMLILGPAVIILRALDERRQERRFLKLSGEEDLPPSYEEATSELDQAPTYSSLNLDTLLATSSPSNSNDCENACLTENCRRGR